MQRFPKALWFARNLLSSPAGALAGRARRQRRGQSLSLRRVGVQQVQRGSARTLDKLTSTGRLAPHPGDVGNGSQPDVADAREMVTDELTRHIRNTSSGAAGPDREGVLEEVGRVVGAAWEDGPEPGGRPTKGHAPA